MNDRKSVGFTSPPVQVIPPMTMFRRETRLSAPYAASRICAYARGPTGLSSRLGRKRSARLGSPQIIQRRTAG